MAHQSRAGALEDDWPYTGSAVNILSVSQAIAYLRELLETDIVLGDIWISGEVSGPRTQPSGHTYFTLKDPEAQLRGVMFRSAHLKQRAAVEHLVQGSQVIVHGRLTIYEARGELQIVVDFVQPEGVGLRHAQFERLRLQLEEEGLFDAARKRPLPEIPQRIGLATSPAGAVLHDIINVLERRWPLAELVLAPTPVQGPDSIAGVVGAIALLNQESDLDLIIVARGGGSIDELWTFNEEAVARAVFGSAVPVVSAVGHETDFTICDYVADLRAPTPSAAAELVAPDRIQVAAGIAAQLSAMGSVINRTVARGRDGAGLLVDRAARAVFDVNQQRQLVDGLERVAQTAMVALQRERQEAVRRSGIQLATLNPQATLARGYAIVHKSDRAVSSIGEVNTGDSLVVKVTDGGFAVRVDSLSKRRVKRTKQQEPAEKTEAASGVQPLLLP